MKYFSAIKHLNTSSYTVHSNMRQISACPLRRLLYIPGAYITQRKEWYILRCSHFTVARNLTLCWSFETDIHHTHMCHITMFWDQATQSLTEYLHCFLFFKFTVFQFCTSTIYPRLDLDAGYLLVFDHRGPFGQSCQLKQMEIKWESQ